MPAQNFSAFTPERIKDYSIPLVKLDTKVVSDEELTAKLATVSSHVVPSVILFGDSITAQNGAGVNSITPTQSTGSSGAVSARGYWNWASTFLGHRLRFVRNAGVSGNTTANMLSRIQADVLAHPSGWVVVAGGANDVTNGVTSSTTISNLTSILSQLTLNGRRVVILTVNPTTYATTTAQKAALREVNSWVIGTAPILFPGVVAVDTSRSLTDPGTGAPGTGLTIDGVHPSDQGAMRMGRAIADALVQFVPPLPLRLPVGSDADSILANPLASSTGWTTFAGAGTAAVTWTPAETRPGVKASVLMTGTNGDVGLQYESNVSTGLWAPGDVVQAVARVRWTNVTPVASAKILWPQVRINARNNAANGSTFVSAVQSMLTAGGEQQVMQEPIPKSGEGWFLTNKLLVGANVDRLYIGALFAGASDGTYEVLDLAAYKAP